MWAPIAILPPGPHADRPAASTLPVGTGWVSSDVDGGTLYVTDGTDWHQAAPGVDTATAAPTGFGGLVVIEAGSQPSVTDSGTSVDVTWRWGISSGEPYFDADGVTAGDEAALAFDPIDGTHVLVPVTV